MHIDPSGLDRRERYRLMISAVVPRPIAWVTTLSADGGLNAAPFSFYGGISASPPLVAVSVGRKRDGQPKDTLRNAKETGEFVVNAAPASLGEEMVACARELPHGESELEALGLAIAPSETVRPPRIEASPVSLECEVERIVDFGGTSMIVGEVRRLYVRDDLLVDGEISFAGLRALGRLGGSDYLDPVEGVVRFERE